MIDKQQSAMVGLVLGAVFLIMGFAWSNPGVWIPGIILLSLGLYLKVVNKREEKDNQE